MIRYRKQPEHFQAGWGLFYVIVYWIFMPCASQVTVILTRVITTFHNLQKKQVLKKHLGWDEASPSCSQSHCGCAHRLERCITAEEEELPPPDGRGSRGSHGCCSREGFSGEDRGLGAACAHGAHLEAPLTAQVPRDWAETGGRIFVWSDEVEGRNLPAGQLWELFKETLPEGDALRHQRWPWFRVPAPTQMKLIPARRMFQPGEGKGSMKPDMWIMLINFLVHWTLADTQVSKHLDLVFIAIKSVFRHWKCIQRNTELIHCCDQKNRNPLILGLLQ